MYLCIIALLTYTTKGSKMEIVITSYFQTDAHSFYGSVATHGQNVGVNTWTNALATVNSMAPPLLDTMDKIIEFHNMVESAGFEFEGGYCGVMYNALFLQWIAGDIQECEHLENDLEDCDWAAHELDENALGSIFKSYDGEVYYYLGN